MCIQYESSSPKEASSHANLTTPLHTVPTFQVHRLKDISIMSHHKKSAFFNLETTQLLHIRTNYFLLLVVEFAYLARQLSNLHSFSVGCKMNSIFGLFILIKILRIINTLHIRLVVKSVYINDKSF